MTTNNSSRRTALKLMLAGSVLLTGTACSVLDSLPRGRTGGSTDGSELALKVRNALRKSPYTSLLTVDISSEGDTVIIKGFVNTKNDVQNIELVANQVDGVRHAVMEVYVQD